MCRNWINSGDLALKTLEIAYLGVPLPFSGLFDLPPLAHE